MTTDQKNDGNATLSTFEGDHLISAELVYCCGYEGGRSAFWPHRAWFCPECGTIWRRAVYEYHFSYTPIPSGAWRVTLEDCPACTQLAFQRIMRELDD